MQLNTAASPPNVQYTATSPRHCSIIIDDSESQDIILHLPAAVAFIRDALQETSCPSVSEPTANRVHDERGMDKGPDEACLAGVQRSNHKVLVHCVMGISRSTTVVCAYCECACYVFCFRELTYVEVMATRRFSPAQALAFVRRREYSFVLMVVPSTKRTFIRPTSSPPELWVLPTTGRLCGVRILRCVPRTGKNAPSVQYVGAQEEA